MKGYIFDSKGEAHVLKEIPDVPDEALQMTLDELIKDKKIQGYLFVLKKQEEVENGNILHE